MIHPHSEVRYISEEKGYGLFATQLIPKGTITWVRDQLDREFTEAELLAFAEPIRERIIHYSYRNREGNYIFCWDNTRYMNHENTPDTCVTPYNLEIAVRDILPGEEITNHYGMLNITEPLVLPEPYNITVAGDDLLRYAPLWDGLLREAFPLLMQVAQPLRPYMQLSDWERAAAVSCGSLPLESVRTLYFAGQ